ncbi:uncharacterized protein RSE6_12144 [Rhynchosporium secalis]|uniref:RING-type domain-containing protein n=1 Tax=Rhynchosporium secalis TaxID=38038 RepID=A0A1E1MPT1_RHYSE|nr:uncharacterized protein RSE6_12144 [Rhynchosporium secalis]
MSSATPTSSSGAAATSLANYGTPLTSLPVTIFIAAFAVLFGLFGLFLIIGVVRRRRNPARYGPRPAIPGRVKQSRKKGLAMAVLESIPVVRFGANNKSDEPLQKDVELSGGLVEDEIPATASRNSRDINEVSPASDITEPPPSHQPTAKEGEMGGGTECSICIADFVESEEVRVLPCDHRFHPACIDPWLLNVSGTCPICRYDLQPEPEASAAETNTATTATPAPVATLAVPSPTAQRERTPIRSRLREIRSAHSGADYISALRNLHRDHEPRRPRSSGGAVAANQETSPT